MKSEPDVFLSYALDTKPLAETLARALQEQGMHVWADFQNLQPGQRWQDTIECAVADAHSFLIIVSPESRTNSWLEAEWRTILSKVWSDSERVLIPVLIGGGDPPPFLRNWVPLRVDPIAEPENWINHVLEALRSRRNEMVHGSTREGIRQERQSRLSEITSSAEELGRREPDRERRPDIGS